MIDNDKIKTLGNLYSLTGEDWVLSVNYCLTEPVCPTAWVRPESLPNFTMFRADRDTLEESINAAVSMAQSYIIDRKETKIECPFANFDDEKILNRMISKQLKKV